MLTTAPSLFKVQHYLYSLLRQMSRRVLQVAARAVEARRALLALVRLLPSVDAFVDLMMRRKHLFEPVNPLACRKMNR